MFTKFAYLGRAQNSLKTTVINILLYFSNILWVWWCFVKIFNSLSVYLLTSIKLCVLEKAVLIISNHCNIFQHIMTHSHNYHTTIVTLWYLQTIQKWKHSSPFFTKYLQKRIYLMQHVEVFYGCIVFCCKREVNFHSHPFSKHCI